ncbi:MAG: TIGR04222 domain-containing membrane protein [Blastocatellia bacterium]|nr:TIGR04222 domain-containing membrane protein [Blastocatellia bacterium]
MEWLTNNALTNLHGFQFLFLYISVAATTIFATWLMVRRQDKTDKMPPLHVPKTPDIYEIAYLRGKENEIIRLSILNLISQAYLQIVSDKISKNPNHPDPGLLSTLDKQIFAACYNGMEAKDVFSNPTISNIAIRYCETYQQNLETKHLLTSQEVKQAAWGIGTAGALLLMCLSGYKIAVAISQGRHNIGFLIFLTIISLVILIFAAKPPRLSKRGKNYLEMLKQVFSNLSNKESLSATSTFDPAIAPMAMAIFGVGILAGTSFDSFEHAFHRSASAGNYGGCGSSCGSSSCGGGGGCGGGCGGGGCGG